MKLILLYGFVPLDAHLRMITDAPICTHAPAHRMRLSNHKLDLQAQRCGIAYRVWLSQVGPTKPTKSSFYTAANARLCRSITRTGQERAHSRNRLVQARTLAEQKALGPVPVSPPLFNPPLQGGSSHVVNPPARHHFEYGRFRRYRQGARLGLGFGEVEVGRVEGAARDNVETMTASVRIRDGDCTPSRGHGVDVIIRRKKGEYIGLQYVEGY
jgi:hypothetical protein